MTFCFRSKEEAEQVAGHFNVPVKPTERIDFQNGGRFWTYDVTLNYKIDYQEIEGSRKGSFSQGGGSANFQAGPFVVHDEWRVGNKYSASLVQ